MRLTIHQHKLLQRVWRSQALIEYEMAYEADVLALLDLAEAGWCDASLWRGYVVFTPRVLSFAKRAA